MSADGTPVLAIDDEPAILRLLRTSLEAQGFHVVTAETGAAGLEQLRSTKPDVVLLDLGLPDMDGLDLITRIRAESSVPIIVLSSREDERGKVEALDRNADDYVTKPFSMPELVARIRTALRHRVQQQGAVPTFRSGDLVVDLVHRIVTVRGQEIHLSPKEYDILRLLVVHAGKVLTHRMIMTEVWGAPTDAQYLRIYVRQLRRKLEENPERPVHILTETGVGYRLRSGD